jgi:glycosyltransferase involved in cell wall biosynthesis
VATDPEGQSENDLPTVSVIIPTYNSEKTLNSCLESIFVQNYPKERLEVIVIDGGSKDATLEIASGFQSLRVLRNPLRTGEAGKLLGMNAAGNEILAFIDSDNVLPCRDWLRRMIAPFLDPDIVGSEPLYYTYRRTDPKPTRYCALVGMNDILCLFLGNYDRYSYATGRWTDLNVKVFDRGDYFVADLGQGMIPTIGANGFMVRSSAIKSLGLESFLFDVDGVHELVLLGFRKFAKVRVGIVHLFADSTQVYLRKTRRRISDYLFYERKGARTYPWRGSNALNLGRFLVSCLTFVPLAHTIVNGYKKVPDRAWLFHITACWLTLLVYSSHLLMNRTRDSD